MLRTSLSKDEKNQLQGLLDNRGIKSEEITA